LEGRKKGRKEGKEERKARQVGRKEVSKAPGGCVRIVQFARPLRTCVDISWVTVSEIPWSPLVKSRNMVEGKQQKKRNDKKCDKKQQKSA
jgi:hypothetical protein